MMSIMTHLTKDQMERLLQAAVQTDSRLYLMCLLGWRHGLRASEICGLRVHNFDLSVSNGQGYLTVARLKGSLRTTQPLFPDEAEALHPLLVGKGGNDFIFPGRAAGSHISYIWFYQAFQKLAASLGLPKHLSHPHVLKHSAGMVVIKKGIEYCRQYLGHKSIASTGAYLRVSDMEASKAAMAAFGD